MSKIKLIGFDLDGTLVNSLPDLTLSVNLTFQEIGLPKASEAEVMTWIGKGVDVLFNHALAWSGQADSFSTDDIAGIKQRFHYFYGQNLCNASRLYPNVKETLQILFERGHTLAVVTNKPTKHVRPVLTSFGLADFFAEMLGGQSLPAIKPHPAPLYYLCGKFACYPSEILFVGDSKNDILAAQAAGCKSVGLTYGYNYNIPITESNPDYCFDDFADILGILS